MKVSKEVTNLVKALNQQTLIAEAAKVKMEELRGELLGYLLEEGVEKVETRFGRAQIVESKSYDFSSFQEIAATKALLDSLKSKAQSEAPCTTSSSLRFFANRAFQVPEIKLTKSWKSSVVVEKAKVTA
jgi:hypothetical protein